MAEVPSTEDIYYTKEEHYDFLNKIKNWTKNRPPDETRVKVMQNDLMKRLPTHNDGIIAVWDNPDGNLECFDGMHRLQAIMNLEREACEKTLILVRHYKNHSEGQIIDEFMRINKSIPVSSIYTEKEAELEMRDTIESVVKKLQSTYPMFFKSSSKPNMPHINRDVLMDKIYEMIQNDERKRSWNIDKWLEYLKNISEKIRGNHALGLRVYKLTPKMKAKCEKYDFWTFAHKQWWELS